MPWNPLRLKKALEEYAKFIESAGVDFSLMEIRLLAIFLNATAECLSREELTRGLWLQKSVHPKTLDVHLFNLRRKLTLTDFKILFVPEQRGWKLLNVPSNKGLTKERSGGDEKEPRIIESRRRVL